MSQWDHLFTQYRQPIAQILLTRNDIADVSAYRHELHRLTAAPGLHNPGRVRRI